MPVPVRMQTISNKHIHLALSAVLVFVLTLPTLRWILTTWLDSPLDRQGPAFAALAGVVLLPLVCSKTQRYGDYHKLAWLILGIALPIYLLGALVSVNLVQALALVGMLTGLLLLAGVSPHTSLIVGLLLLLATPTTSFLLGRVVQPVFDSGYAAGVVLKWPLAAALIVSLLASLRPTLIMLLAAPFIVGISLIATADLSEPSILVYWTGTASWASLLSLILSAASGLLLIKTWPKQPT